jgi:hypothetical protein
LPRLLPQNINAEIELNSPLPNTPLALRFLVQRTPKYLANEWLNFATFLNHRASA